MKKILINWVLSALCLYALSFIFDGIYFSGFTPALLAAVIFGLINITIKPILKIISIPITILTLGIFSLVINALMLILTSNFVAGFSVDGFGTAFWAAIVLSVLNTVFTDRKKGSKK